MYQRNYDEHGVRLNTTNGGGSTLSLKSMYGGLEQEAGLSDQNFSHAREKGQAAIIHVTGPSRDMGLTATQCRALASELIKAAERQEDFTRDLQLKVARKAAREAAAEYGCELHEL